MREIKFRAWDKSRNEYLSNGNVFISVNPGSRPLNSFVYLDLIDRPDAYKSRFILEQYTGLRDKNGTEIYEGDIIKNTANIHWDLQEVKYGDCRNWILDGVRNKPFKASKCGCLISGEARQTFEVIGNIHENPELLHAQN